MGGGGPDAQAILNLLTRPDLFGVIALFLFALFRGWLVLGTYHEERVKSLERQLAEAIDQRDRWMDAALRSTGLATQATGLAERYGSRGGPQGYGQGGQPPQGYGQPPGGAPQMPPQQYGPRQPQPGPQEPPQYPPSEPRQP